MHGITQNSEADAFDIPGAARQLVCSEPYVRLLIRNKLLKAKKQGRRVVVLREEINRYLANLPEWQPGQAPQAAVAARRTK